MQKLSGAVQLTLGLVLGLILGFCVVGVANQPHATPSSTTTTLPKAVVVHQPVYEFFAGDTGVQCEIVTNLAQSGPVPLNDIACFTNVPPRRVTLTDEGKIEQCSCMQCLANPGLNTPHLSTSTTVVSGNHFCQVLRNGVRCGNASSVTFTMTGAGAVIPGPDAPFFSVTNEVFAFFGTTASGVECEMTMESTLCITTTPPQRAILDGFAQVSTCDGVQCLSNPGLGTPTLLAGTRVTNGVFTCDVQALSVECRYKDGRGFSMSTAGITRLL
jgi:hypothetical protein